MNMPGFTADATLRRRATETRSNLYLRQAGAKDGKVVPAIPACANCDWILDRCERNGGKPAGLCSLCAMGNCY